MPYGEVIFDQCPQTGFPYIDLDEHLHIGVLMLVQIVCINYDGFTKQQTDHAIEAKQAQVLIDHPSR